MVKDDGRFIFNCIKYGHMESMAELWWLVAGGGGSPDYTKHRMSVREIPPVGNLIPDHHLHRVQISGGGLQF